jgi:hypothetical protein
MRVSRFLDRKDVRSSRRTRSSRLPMVDALEGRQLLSTFTKIELGVPQAETLIVGQHIGVAETQKKMVKTDIVGQHIGVAETQKKMVKTDIVGQHIGVAETQKKMVKTDIVGQHIGSPMIQGNHIGYQAAVPDSGVLRKH